SVAKPRALDSACPMRHAIHAIFMHCNTSLPFDSNDLGLATLYPSYPPFQVEPASRVGTTQALVDTTGICHVRTEAILVSDAQLWLGVGTAQHMARLGGLCRFRGLGCISSHPLSSIVSSRRFYCRIHGSCC